MNPDENAPWKYKSDKGLDGSAEDSLLSTSSSSNQRQPLSSRSSFGWTAYEYVEHQRSAGWYALLAAGCIVIAAGFFLAKDYFGVVTILILGIIVGLFARRKPQKVNYELNDTGLKINEKIYTYNQFKSFAIVRGGNLTSINLQPRKRFALPITAYIDTKDEQQITNVLGQSLPLEVHKVSFIDRASHRLRL